MVRRVGSYMDSKYIYDNGPNNLPTAELFGPNFLASKLYQLSPPEVRKKKSLQFLLWKFDNLISLSNCYYYYNNYYFLNKLVCETGI